jgi:hypothetical protein
VNYSGLFLHFKFSCSAQLRAAGWTELGSLSIGFREVVGELHHAAGIPAVPKTEGAAQLVNRFF